MIKNNILFIIVLKDSSNTNKCFDKKYYLDSGLLIRNPDTYSDVLLS